MDHIVYLLTQYRYFILFPLAIVEGPILAVIAGFLCVNGFLNLFIVYPIIVLGDIVGDSVVYTFGRWGAPGFIKKMGKGLAMNPKKINSVRAYFDSNPTKTISLSKVTLGIGVAGIYLAGNAKIPYERFIRICVVTSALQYIIYLGIGLLFGDAYKQISHYLDFFAALTITVTLAIILFYIIKSIRKKI
jgi:membrane-associated protein